MVSVVSCVRCGQYNIIGVVCVISTCSYNYCRGQLYEYLKNRMLAIAPNLTLMVGELVGARLIAHAGMCSQSLWCYHTDKFIVFQGP